MSQSKEEQSQPLNSFMNSSAWGLHPMMQMPMVAILAEMNGTLLESTAIAQKEWADFFHRRIKEDVAVSRQLMQCHSLAEMQQIYSQYFSKAFEQYQQQSTKVVQRGQSMAEHLAEAAQKAADTAPARH
jgi:beta-phosphoglucomutase-like phosphatase (HAD superfamily)